MHDTPLIVLRAVLSLVPLVTAAGQGHRADDEIAAALLAKERAYLAALGHGNPDPMLAVVAPDVSYHDPDLDARIDDRAALAGLFEPLRGKELFRGFELRNARVQVYGDAAVVSFNWVGEEIVDGGVRPASWNTTEVWQLQGGDWRIVSSHWSYTTPSGKPGVPRSPAAGGSTLAGDAAAVVAAERACLDRWKRGDPGGFIDAASPEISYFDPSLERRVDGREEFTRVMEAIRGQVVFDRYELLDPRVQFVGELAVLTFNYQSFVPLPEGGSRSSFWNSTEVYHRRDGRWQQVHSHWSRTRAVR